MSQTLVRIFHQEISGENGTTSFHELQEAINLWVKTDGHTIKSVSVSTLSDICGGYNKNLVAIVSYEPSA